MIISHQSIRWALDSDRPMSRLNVADMIVAVDAFPGPWNRRLDIPVDDSESSPSRATIPDVQ